METRPSFGTLGGGGRAVLVEVDAVRDDVDRHLYAPVGGGDGGDLGWREHDDAAVGAAAETMTVAQEGVHVHRIAQQRTVRHIAMRNAATRCFGCHCV